MLVGRERHIINTDNGITNYTQETNDCNMLSLNYKHRQTNSGARSTTNYTCTNSRCEAHSASTSCESLFTANR